MSDARARRCWCGNDELLPFNDATGYCRCALCETLVYAGELPQPVARVRDDLSDFYGQQYWLNHQRERSGYPDIQTRLRADLPERGAYWLNALLQFKLPPARVLELGSAHGGFIALLRQAGFDATGLDLSPAVVELARETFDVPMLLGPIEDQRIEKSSLDCIVLMDVLEHLPDPVGTMWHCQSLLKPQGVLLVQTPCYPAAKSLEQIREHDARFAVQLRPAEHVNLFSKQSARRLMQRVGVPHVEFLPAIFWFYDMFFVASAQPIARMSIGDCDAALGASPSRRIAQAIVDGEDRFRDLLDRHRTSLAENRQLREQLMALLTARQNDRAIA